MSRVDNRTLWPTWYSGAGVNDGWQRRHSQVLVHEPGSLIGKGKLGKRDKVVLNLSPMTKITVVHLEAGSSVTKSSEM